MFILIPSLITIASVVIAGVIIHRRIPKDIEGWNKTVASEDFGPTFYQKALAIASEKSKKIVLNVSTKLVYRLKIGTLKTDNFFGKLLQSIRSHKQSMQTEQPVEESILSSEVSQASAKQARDISVQADPVVVSVQSPVLEQNNFEALEQRYINQLTYNPKDVSIYKKLGWLYLENSRPMQSREAFKTALKLGSKDKMIMAKLLEMGGTLRKEGPALKVELSRQTSHNTEEAISASPAFSNRPISSGRLAKIRKIKVTRTKV
ncbi:MAG: hypothetical protein AAB911_02070 [Patescibacteria group bacterium]